MTKQAVFIVALLCKGAPVVYRFLTVCGVLVCRLSKAMVVCRLSW